MLTRDPAAGEISQIGVALQDRAIMRPTTERVLEAFREEAQFGIGTFNADLLAREIEAPGKTMSLEEWQSSPYFDPDITYYPTMTIAGAIAHKEAMDFTKKNAEVISRASLGQKALGFGAAFVAGMEEPKNLMAGVAASAVLSPIGGAGVTGIKSAKNLLNIYRSVQRYGDLAARGFGEGLVAVMMTEPSNRSSAKVLQQEYTLADTLWNVGLSAALGGVIAPVPAFVRDKMNRNGARVADIIAEEIDLATAQLAEGRKVDVDVVEQVRGRDYRLSDTVLDYRDGQFDKKMIAVRDGEQIGYIEYSEFDGLPAIKNIEVLPNSRRQGVASDMLYELQSLYPDKEIEFGMLTQEGAALEQSLQFEQINLPEYNKISKQLSEAEVELGAIRREAARLDGAPDEQRLEFYQKHGDRWNELSDIVDDLSSQIKVIPKVKRILVSKDNVVSKIESSQKPEASTAIDSEGVKVTEQRLRDMPEKPNYQKEFDNDMERIRDMVKQNVISEDEFSQFLDALDAHNDANIKEALNTLEGCILRG